MEPENESVPEEDAGNQLMLRVERPVYDERFLRAKLLHRKEDNTTFCQRLADRFRCSSVRVKAAVLSFLPILTWLPSYPVKQYLFSDVISGLSTGVVQLPQGLAYALLAAVPPVYGLYSSFYPVLLYTLFGTSRHVSIGKMSYEEAFLQSHKISVMKLSVMLSMIFSGIFNTWGRMLTLHLIVL
ncbi:hypothetical protein GOODEAATRI_031436 [Goodea atripinnis]|uniref:SLC26A/SulP transporter domain-containing protein n=1 Tax=Goodea atripinnis TaxID=208336 RepID=A0ABV0Q2P2_9TELE